VKKGERRKEKGERYLLVDITKKQLKLF